MVERRSKLTSGVSFMPQMPQARVPRKPQHTFYLKLIPYTIQPFMIAPVLPGETLENFMVQARAVTDPIKNPVIGWWFEMYFFYIKHRDLDDRDTFMGMMVDPAINTSALLDSNDAAKLYYAPGGNNSLNWANMCLKRVTEDYFRSLDEAWNNVTISTLPVAAVVGNSFLDSFKNDDAYQTSIEPTIDTSGASVGITAIQQAMRDWQLLQLNNMTEWTYEDYLRSYGVKLPSAEEAHKPELIRFLRQWQYPSNTINESTGAPTSAVSWSIAERGDKARFFKEPGFIFGVAVCRPKTYFANASEPVVNYMQSAQDWLPAVMADDPNTSLKQFTAGTGPLKANTDDYWLDIRDLLLYGDQFLNETPSTASKNSLTLPTAAGVWKYPTDQTELDRLFVAANATVKVDGIVHLNIMGRQRDMT